MRVRGPLGTRARHLSDKTHHDVSPGQVVAHQPFTTGQRLVDKPQVVGNFALDARRQWCARFTQARNIQLEQKRQHGRTFGVMQPLLVRFVVGCGGVGPQFAATMAAQDVIHYRPRLVNRAALVGDDRRLAQRVNRHQFRWRQPCLRVALVGLHVIRQAQLFEQPQHTL